MLETPIPGAVNEDDWRSVPKKQKAEAPIGELPKKRSVSAGDQFIYLKVLKVVDDPESGTSIATCDCKCGNEVEIPVKRLDGSNGSVQRYCSRTCAMLREKYLAPGGVLEKGREALKQQIEEKRKVREADNTKLRDENAKLKAEIQALHETIKGEKEPELPLDLRGLKHIGLLFPVQVWALWAIRAARTGRSLPQYLTEYFLASLAFEARKDAEVEAMAEEETRAAKKQRR